MGKIKLLLLLSVFFVGELALACGSTISGGAGHSWQGNASSPCPSNTGPSSTGVKADIGGMNFGPGYAEAMAAKAKIEECTKEKGKIETKFATCNSSVSSDNLRETAMCNAYGTTAVSGSIQVRIFNIGGTIENPTYDKCINLVNSLTTYQKDLCYQGKVEDEAVARSWNGGACSALYQ